MPLAFQLGVETTAAFGALTAFRRQYNKVNLTRTLTANFPIGNSQGIVGLRSLSPGESTKVLHSLLVLQTQLNIQPACFVLRHSLLLHSDTACCSFQTLRAVQLKHPVLNR